MNRPLRRVAIVALAMFLALLINLNYLGVVEAPHLRTASGNARVLLTEYNRQRGPILVGGKAVALSKATDDRLKYLRRYPLGPLYAHETGYYSVVYGATAIERQEDEVLAGTDAKLFVRRLVDLFTGRKPQGGAVALTLDPRAQKAAYDALGNRRGAVVAIQPSTGRILAMVSRPSYDPNSLSSHDPSAIRKAYTKLNTDPDSPLLNRAISARYPPGSTFKIVTTAAALSSGNYQPDSTIPGPAALDLPQTSATLPNEDGRQCTPGSDTTTLANALRRSCNSSFGALGLALGADALRQQAEKFGFGQSIEVPMPSAVSVFPKDPNAPQTAQSAIGQFDVAATPLEMAMVVSAIANRGILMKPYLVDEVRAPDLTLLSRTEPQELSEAVSPEVAATLTSMLVDVVDKGTGTNAQIPGVKVAGKTGTAQHGTGTKPHAWFVSFAPAQDAKVAVAVIVEDGGNATEISGNRVAAPIAKAVMEAVLGGGS
ncbi:MAG: peptidoglycan D,D-transpeptidase FtsI family protein [Actinomycetales bacterium]